jgi:transposase
MRHQTVIKLASGLPRCVMAMEACCGAHHLGRILHGQGHEVRLMSPEYVRPYVKAQKNDDRDAEAIAEAASRPTMRFVELKSQAQLDLQSLHRVRSRLVNARKALINQLRAILLERGHVAAEGPSRLDKALDAMLDDADFDVSARIRTLIIEMRDEWRELDRRIAALEAEFKEHVRTHEPARRLTTVPGIGVLTATALTAAIGDGSAFRRGRDLAAWLGPVPRQVTTGGRPKLLGITKRGNKYLRMLFIHGARSAAAAGKKRDAPMPLAARPTGARPSQCRRRGHSTAMNGSGTGHSDCRILRSWAFGRSLRACRRVEVVRTLSGWVANGGAATLAPDMPRLPAHR